MKTMKNPFIYSNRLNSPWEDESSETVPNDNTKPLLFLEVPCPEITSSFENEDPVMTR